MSPENRKACLIFPELVLGSVKFFVRKLTAKFFLLEQKDAEELSEVNDFIEARKKNWETLREGLENLSDKLILPEPEANSDPSWFGFLLTVREGCGIAREQIVRHLESNGIQTRMLFAGNMIKHPCFDEMRKSGKGYRAVGRLKNTDIIMNRTFWVGVYPGMAKAEIEYMIDRLKHCLVQ